MPKSGGGSKSKKGGGLKLLWIPTGGHKSHKHKKNKYYVRDNDSPKSAMMSGDSPNSHSKHVFDFKEGRSTPPPTTSKDIAIQSSSTIPDPKTDIVAASVLADPLKEHGPGTNFVGVLDGHPDRKNDDEILATEDKPLKDDSNHPEGGDKNDKRDAQKKINGTIDQLDGNWVPPGDVKKDDDEQDDNCTVKCLYYTLQCCECTIM